MEILEVMCCVGSGEGPSGSAHSDVGTWAGSSAGKCWIAPLEGAENTSKFILKHLHCLQCKHLENFSLIGTLVISVMLDFIPFWLCFIGSSSSLPWGFSLGFCYCWIFVGFFFPLEVCNLLRIKEFLGNRKFSTLPKKLLLKKIPVRKMNW